MKKVCLKTGLSYVAKGISCRKGKVVEVEDDVAARLLKTGRFEIMGMEPVVPEFVDLAPESPAPESPAPTGNPTNITSMKKDELIAFAEEPFWCAAGIAPSSVPCIKFLLIQSPLSTKIL